MRLLPSAAPALIRGHHVRSFSGLCLPRAFKDRTTVRCRQGRPRSRSYRVVSAAALPVPKTPAPTVTMTVFAPAQTITRTVTPPPATTAAAPAPQVQPQPQFANATAVVTQFYQDITDHNYTAAWALGGNNVSGGVGYDAWVAGYGTTESIDLGTFSYFSSGQVQTVLSALQTSGAVHTYPGTSLARQASARGHPPARPRQTNRLSKMSRSGAPCAGAAAASGVLAVAAVLCASLTGTGRRSRGCRQ